MEFISFSEVRYEWRLEEDVVEKSEQLGSKTRKRKKADSFCTGELRKWELDYSFAGMSV